MCRELCLAVLCAAVSSAFADVWVDCNTLSATHDGTKEHPYLTIQEGVVACPVGETVWVKPGLYAASGAVESPDGHHSVVSIAKAITVASTGGKFRTVIQGKKGAASSGLGADAVRCVYIGSDAAAVVRGFTMIDGYSDSRNSGSDTDANRGGGVLCSKATGDANNQSSTAAFIVDCIITDCKAQRGGGLHGSSAVRCFVYNTSAVSSGPAERNANTYNCVFYKIAGGNLFHGTHVNTTVITPRSNDSATTGAPKCYNCLFMGPGKIHTGVSSGSKPQFYNCVANTTVDQTSIDVSQSEYATWSNSLVDADGAAYEIPRLDFTSVSALQGTTPAGSVSNLSKIPESYRDLDFNGSPLPTSGACYAGAVQTAFAAQPTTATFPVQRNDPKKGVFFIDGRPIWLDGEVHFDAPYVTVTGQGVGEFRFVGVRYAKAGSVYLPDMADNKILFTPAGGATALGDKLTGEFQRPIWADANAGDDTTADGTEAKPYKTLQAAYDKATKSDETRLVLAKPGDYNEGGKVGCDLMSRLVLNTKVYVRSTDGAATTFISGASDTTDQADADGNGPNAVRCLSVPGASGGSVQGFTLRNGRASTSAGGGKADRGGAICCGFGSIYLSACCGGGLCPTILDCTITGCTSPQAIIFYGYLKRCRITGNFNQQAISSGAWNFACLFDGNAPVGGKGYVFAGDSRILNCTITKNVGYSSIVGGNSYVINGIFYRNGCNDLVGSSPHTNCLYKTGTPNANSPNCRQDYPYFVDYGHDDFRLADISPAFGMGVTNYLFSGSLNADKNPSNTWAFCDYSGYDQQSLFSPDGSVTVGACGGRNAVGDVHKVFVAPTGDDETGDGSAAKPYGTIQKAIDEAEGRDESAGFGGVVRAAAGTYATGGALSGKPASAVPTLWARLVCEKDILIESEEGAAKTFIVGAADTTSGQADSLGNGPDAVRCAYMSKGTLKGFTLVDGHTQLYVDVGGGPTVNDEGGGFYSEGTPVVTDCVVSNCYAVRAGAAHGGLWRNCRFYGCDAMVSASFFRYPRQLHQCYFGAKGKANPVVAGCTDMNGCTFNCGVPTSQEVLNNCTPMANTVIDGGNIHVAKTDSVMTRCAYDPAKIKWTIDSGLNLLTNDCVVGAVAMDADGVPVKGSSVAIDAALPYPDTEVFATDLAGNPRVSNGVADIGCFEYDWRGDYAKAVYPRRFDVDAASSATVLTEDGVLVRDGALEGTWTWKNSGCSATMHYSVTGTGTLYVYQDDTLVNTATAASGAQSTELAGDTRACSTVKFVYEPGANDDGGALIAKAGYQGGGMTILLR